MWPFNKKPKAATQIQPIGEISYSQLDITESFGDNLRLKSEDWIGTIALNKTDLSGLGLPPIDASDETVYATASRLSTFRESVPIPNDGVYCPLPYCKHCTFKITDALSQVRAAIAEVWLGLT
jgi:hypothetical protein